MSLYIQMLLTDTPQIETNRKLMQQNLHLSYPNAIDKPNISLQKFASPKFAVFYV